MLARPFSLSRSACSSVAFIFPFHLQEKIQQGGIEVKDVGPFFFLKPEGSVDSPSTRPP